LHSSDLASIVADDAYAASTTSQQHDNVSPCDCAENANAYLINDYAGTACVETDAVVDILSSPGNYAAYAFDYPIDRYSYVSPSELELRNTVGESDKPDLDLLDWESNTYKDHAGLASSMQDLEFVALDIVPGLFPSSSTRSHDFQERETHATMHETSSQHGRTSQRPSAAVKDWYLAHSSSPYPSPDEVQEHQVKICLSNLRARSKEGN
jgi:hypothetical protein